ncbi:sacsin N-terminal ATP-binding-like domain-containing protein [Blastococcus brunescens]|uniref:Molecular chaperone Hsp90 n=1 Tax=Blastococcus brunescens TaxID=1564165 RepID=A0ABZ1AUV4_9ACTN|nr:hypothetical protein [Blastococcus sp. BMG 8361]WRL62332.1 hypothetical protein U6N30_20160 [Blastococcus sp. BMG 8361]
MSTATDGDPFGTAGIRQRVLSAWREDPARFREDANAEEDLVRGGYRDRLLVELAQNAADAAVRAGVRGQLRLELRGTTLCAANTGAPLDAAGVQGLATLRASAKRDETAAVGRFGVGFAAVLAVSDEPALLSTTGGVRFGADPTRKQVLAVPALAAEVARRAGGVPVLRLPWPTADRPPDGYATEVVLPLRDGAVPVVAAALADLRADVLLALPGLSAVDVVVDGVVRGLRIERTPGSARLTDGPGTTTWAVAERSGELAAQLLADRPVEERARRAWTVTAAVPLDDDGRPAPLPPGQVVHAPTPSDEPLSLPVRLIAPFPLDPDRRHVAAGPVTDALVESAAATCADLVAGLPADPAVLALVPRVGLAGAELDAALCGALLDRLRALAWLPVAADREARQTPERATALDDPTEERVAALGDVVPGLLPAGWSRRSDARTLTALGVRRIGVAEAVEAVRGVARPASWWAGLYAALDGADREELAALPVPLADGRTAHGPAGVLLPDAELPVHRLAPLGLRLAEPDAVAPAEARRLLERLGAQPATARTVLADPAVRAAVGASMDAVDDPLEGRPSRTSWPRPCSRSSRRRVRRRGAALAGRAGATRRRRGWAPAGELVRPGSVLADVLAEGSLGVLDDDMAATADPDALRAVGVLDTFGLVHAEDPDDLDVDDADRWVDEVLDRLPPDGPPPRWPALTAVRDLELVTDWDRALPLVAALPAGAWADVVLDGVAVPGYLRWWLSTHPVLAGERPDRLRDPGSTELQGLYEPAAAAPEVLALLRPPASVADVLADVDAAIDLLDRLGDPVRTVRPDVLRTVYARLAGALDGIDVDPPERVRVAPDRVVTDAVVLDLPWLQPLVRVPVVPAGGAPGAVADLLDLPLASERVRGGVTAQGDRRPWAGLPGAALAAARLGAEG